MMREAFIKEKMAQSEYEEANQYLEDGNSAEWECTQRESYQHYGKACGIYATLAWIGFEHKDMKKLCDLV